MKTYKSHKLVQAALITGYERTYQDTDGNGPDVPWGAKLLFGDNDPVQVDEAWLKKHGGQDHDGPDAAVDLVGGYFVVYEDSYTSWSPRAVFEQGYSAEDFEPTAVTHDIAWALAKMEDGYAIRRPSWVEGWNYKKNPDADSIGGPFWECDGLGAATGLKAIDLVDVMATDWEIVV